jgi:hypothetical protein
VGRVIARLEEIKNENKILVGKLEGKRLPGRHRRRWQDNIKMYLTDIGQDDVDWTNLA